jgi:hypothetical protein
MRLSFLRMELAGTHPKNLRVLAIFGFSRALRQLRRTSEGVGVRLPREIVG